MTAAEKYREALRACLLARDVHGLTEKAARAAAVAGIPLAVAVAEITASARIPLAVAEIPPGEIRPPCPMIVVAYPENEGRVAEVVKVVAPSVVAFCRELELRRARMKEEGEE